MPGRPGDERQALTDDLHHAWKASATSAGLRAPTREQGVDVRDARVGHGLGRYVLGLELARGDLKHARGSDGHRSAFEVLDDAVATGAVADLLRWREYEQATRGRRALTWSRGLKVLYAIGEQTDEEIAAELAGGATVGHVPARLWSDACALRGFRVELQTAMVDHGRDGVDDYLARIEIEVLDRHAAIPARGAQERRAVEMRLAAQRLGRSVEQHQRPFDVALDPLRHPRPDRIAVEALPIGLGVPSGQVSPDVVESVT